ncbi:MAG: peptide chain release factor N(5)-glutamine methyltransferase [Chloroflexota bacterium]
MTHLSACLEELSRRLRPLSDTPDLDAQVLLARSLNRSRAWLAAHPEARLDPKPAAALEASVQRLERGEPLPYVLGEWEFFGLAFEVTPDVLIPRPETELLVERAIFWLRHRPTLKRRATEAKSAEADSLPRVLDIGTGCGCIAISLAVNVPGIQVTATDISPAALEVARRNAVKQHVAEQIIFLEADLIPESDRGPLTADREVLSTVHGPRSYDLIAANLPYIPTQTLRTLPVYTREPPLALDGGADGLDLIRRLLAKAPALLAPGGLMLLEIEASQGPAILSLAYGAFEQAEIHLHQDLAGHDRLLEIKI